MVCRNFECPTCGISPQDGARPAIQFSPSELGCPDCGNNTMWLRISAVRLVAIFRRMERGLPFSSSHQSLAALIVANNTVCRRSSAVLLVAIVQRIEQGPPFSSAHLSLAALIVAITLYVAGARLSDLWQYSREWSEARLTLSFAALIVAIILYGAGARLSDLWQYSGGWSEAAS
jgi:hypothetical protein